MDGKVRLDQVFYGYGQSGYGLAGYSFDDEGAAWAAINVCLAIGQATGSRLPKPILLSRILGDKIVMARICNGAKDSSGRNTLFVHALVGLAQEVRTAHITAFTLDKAGIFRDNLSGNPVDVIEVAANPAPATASHEPLELPAAIETSAPDEKLVRRIVSGRENELSWSSFAFEDMPGYDVICLSPLASSPMERNIYDAELKLVRGVTVKRKAPAPASLPHVEKPSCPPLRNPKPKEGVRKGRNGLLISLLISIAINVVLLSAFVLTRAKDVTQATGNSNKSQSDDIVKVAKRMFAGKNAVTDLGPIQTLLNTEDGHKEDEKEKAQRELLNKLLAYKLFVEEFILNQTKEK